MQHPHRPGPSGLYDPAFEHDACGVGFVADMDGRRRHDVLAMGLTAIANLSHRGAVASDGRTSDGTGVLTQLPHALLARDLPAPPALGDLAAGMIFLPPEAAERRAAEAIAEAALRRHGLEALAWRDVPVAPEVLGDKARLTMPAVRQLLVARPAALDAAAFERRLLVARKAMAREAASAGHADFYVCSLSAATIVYKGLVMADALAAFYPDLRDPAYETAVCVFHQRYSTNTFPTWPLAQPFRVVAHNGEINTIAGNRHWMGAREADLAGGGWSAAELAELAPVIEPGGSDSASLDNTLELLSRSGRTLVHALMMLMPEALGPDADPELGGFYDYHACLMEPWDGPAAVAFTDGRLVGARLDRNGLRPARYLVTDDRLVVLGSEAGMLEIPACRVTEKGQLGPGQSLILDTGAGRIYRHAELGAEAARHRPYRAWVAAETLAPGAPAAPRPVDPAELHARQQAFGLTAEDVEKLLVPMATTAKEPVGSMGDDTPLAALSRQPRTLYHYFAQRFAQVTNPPIDPLRERLVMRLDTWLGARRSLLEATPGHARLVRLPSPVLTPGELAALAALPHPRLAVLPATWAAAAGEAGLEARLEALGAEAVAAVRAGAGVLVLSDRWVSPERVAVPMPLALAAVREALLAAGIAMRASVVCEAGDVVEDHAAAVLLGYGAAAVCPHVAVESLEALAAAGQVGGLAPAAAVAGFKAAMEAGLRKIMAKMGISAIASYQGAQLFEILGLGDAVAARYFPGTPSRLGGRDLGAIARQALGAHAVAYPGAAGKLPDVGRYRYRVGGEYHANGPDVFKAIQKLAKSGVREDVAALAAVVGGRPPVSVRDLLRFRPDVRPVPLEAVEPAEAIVRRFVASAMSLGSLSPEAHACIAVAMNRLGGKSNSGEGGEDPARFVPRPDGDSANSTIKQVASGRFGVTPAYLTSADELEIKMAQGAKPGEGGQLPASKVNAEIARLRHATPGTSLISPPPHHDIYSIEDLAQLIVDLRSVHPRARIAVKLVSVAGVGTIAAGVAKAHADVIHVSGHDGGTGASPLGSIKHAGVPWELGLAEAQQVLVMNDLRGRVTLRADGGLKTGRDVVVAALLGAEEFAFGTALLIAAGCVMIRQCHANTCPTGIATQDPALRARFKGTPENVVNYLRGVAEDVRAILAGLGLTSLEAAVGRIGLLEPVPGVETATGMRLERVLADPDPTGTRPRRRVAAWRREPAEGLDAAILEAVGPAIAGHGHARVAMPIRNVDRAVGARVAGAIAERHGDTGFTGRLELAFTGSAGQSFGAFVPAGVTMTLVGEANDYLGKGLAGGVIAVRPAPDAGFDAGEAVIVGNTVLYGATGGRVFAAGRAGERFAVRNSGAVAVIEGVGDHGCEYMTGGCVVVVGAAGRNFGAGMTGGVAYVLDAAGTFPAGVNAEAVRVERVADPADVARLEALLAEHARRTGSARASALLAAPETWPGRFWKVVPAAAPQPMGEIVDAAPVGAPIARTG